jgi:hypothetical protein
MSAVDRMPAIVPDADAERLRLLRSAYELRRVAETHPHLGIVPLATAYACRVRASRV